MPRYNKHVIVLGSARSGTSWVSENLAKPYRYRMLFEPEHPEQTKNGKLLADQWFDNSSEPSRPAMNYFNKIFKNRVDSDWIAQNSNRKYKRHLWPFIPKKFVIKFIRLNLSARYLHDTFKIPIAFITRHPLDLISSQKRVSFPWLYDFTFFQQQDKLVSFIDKEFGYQLNAINEKSKIEKLAVRWCLENVIPLQYQSIPQNDFHIIKYEDLRNNIDLYKNLCNDLNFDVLPGIDEEFKKPSTKTHPRSTIRGNQDKRKFISDEEEKVIIKVLKQFKQNLYVI